MMLSGDSFGKWERDQQRSRMIFLKLIQRHSLSGKRE
jgi:hypothetical protein